MTVGAALLDSGGGLAQSTAKHLGQKILRGDLLPGTPLPPENEILAEIGIGRSTLREAFRILSSKGFISSRQRSGTRVRPREEWNDLDLMVIAWTAEIFDVDEILLELYEYRRLLEPEAARLAAERASDAEIKAIQIAFSAMQQSLGSRKDEIESDIRLHVEIILAANNRFLTPLATAIKSLLRIAIERSHSEPAPLAKSVEMHRAVVEAIAARDGSGAQFAMRCLVEDAITTFRRSRHSREADSGQ